MAGEVVKLNDEGTIFECTITDQDGSIVDVSTAVAAGTKQIIFLKPDGKVDVQEATFTNDGTDGLIQHISAAGDLDVKGDWEMQGYVELGGGKWHSDIHEFTVTKNLR